MHSNPQVHQGQFDASIRECTGNFNVQFAKKRYGDHVNTMKAFIIAEAARIKEPKTSINSTERNHEFVWSLFIVLEIFINLVTPSLMYPLQIGTMSRKKF